MECKHIFKRGKETGTKCNKNGLHDGFCHKHKKTAVPQEVIDAVGQAPKAKVKSRFSAFNWTINSNTAATTKTQVDQFKEIIEFIFRPDSVVEYLRDGQNADDPSANIVDIASVFHFEIAPGNKTVHAHGAVKLEHHGHYRLALHEIRAIVEGILGKKIHFQVQPSGNAERAWEQYMTKNQGADKV